MNKQGSIALILLFAVFAINNVYADSDIITFSPNRETYAFDTPGDYSLFVPDGITAYLKIQAWGGGGGGGRGIFVENGQSGGGGGGGGYAQGIFSGDDYIKGPQTLTIHVGKGGKGAPFEESVFSSLFKGDGESGEGTIVNGKASESNLGFTMRAYEGGQGIYGQDRRGFGTGGNGGSLNYLLPSRNFIQHKGGAGGLGVGFYLDGFVGGGGGGGAGSGGDGLDGQNSTQYSGLGGSGGSPDGGRGGNASTGGTQSTCTVGVCTIEIVGSRDNAWIFGSGADYSTARSTSSFMFTPSNNQNNMGQSFSGANYVVSRTFYKFNTSLIGAGSNIAKVTLKNKINSDSSATDFDIQIVKYDWSSQDPITDGNRETAYDGCLGVADNITLINTANISRGVEYTSGNLDSAWVNKTGITYYCLRSSRDKSNIAPEGLEDLILEPPVLRITFLSNPIIAQNGAFPGGGGGGGYLADGEQSTAFKGGNGADGKVIITIKTADPMLIPIGSRSVTQGIQLNFTITATSLGESNLTFAIAGKPTTADFIDNHDGTAAFSWMPSLSDVSVKNINFTVSDGIKSTSEVVVITVNEFPAPTTSSTNPGEIWKNADYNVLLNATGIKQVAYINYSLNNISGQITGSFGNVLISTNGNNTLMFYAVDIFGDVETQNTIYALLDKIAPNITSFILSPTSVNIGDAITGACTATDNFSNVITNITGIDTSTAGTKTAICTATDDAGNIATASAAYTVNTASSNNEGGSNNAGSGGGGGGSITTTTTINAKTYAPGNAELSTGYAKVLGKNDAVKFTYDNAEHSVTVNDVNSTNIKITVASTPQIVVMKSGETKKFELNGDNKYDLEIAVGMLDATSAAIVLKTISEDISAGEQNSGTMPNEEKTGETAATRAAGGITGAAIGAFAKKPLTLAIAFLILIVIIYLVIRFRRRV